MAELDRLVDEAQLSHEAADAVRTLPAEVAERLVARWDDAVAEQDRSLRDAVDGALGMLPRLLRRQVLKVLSGALS